MDYLQLAKEKRKASKEVDYSLPLIQFISWCYINLTPSGYGVHIQKYICHLKLKLIELGKDLALGDFKFSNTSGEFKVTYLTKDNYYCFTHLRQWQNYKYYMLCLIDCDNDFTPEFYLITKKNMGKFKLGYMNGTSEENKNQENREQRVSIKKDSKEHKMLKKFNMLNDTTYDTLVKYVKLNNI
jgi:hypothetical protein